MVLGRPGSRTVSQQDRGHVPRLGVWLRVGVWSGMAAVQYKRESSLFLELSLPYQCSVVNHTTVEIRRAVFALP